MATTPTQPHYNAPAYYSPALPAAAPEHVKQKSSALWSFIKGAAILGGGVALVSYLGTPNSEGASIAKSMIGVGEAPDANIFQNAIEKVGEGLEWGAEKINGFSANIPDGVDTDKIVSDSKSFLPVAGAAALGGITSVAWNQIGSPSTPSVPSNTSRGNTQHT